MLVGGEFFDDRSQRSGEAALAIRIGRVDKIVVDSDDADALGHSGCTEAVEERLIACIAERHQCFNIFENMTESD